MIIGSEGNIGRPLVRHLRESGYDTLEVDLRAGHRSGYLMADITNSVDLLPAFDLEPDVVFLLSAMVSRVTCEQAAGLAIATNLTGVNNVLQLVKRVGAKLVFFSTSEIYGPECDVMSEEIKDPAPNNRYGLSKLLGERLVEYEMREHGLDAVTLRPFMVYDEQEQLGDHRSAMIRFAYNLARGEPIEIHSGSARGWLHVSDAVTAIEAAVHVPEYAAINIGHPDIRPMRELAEMIRERLDAPEELLHNRALPAQMTLVKRPTLERMRHLLGVEPQVELEEGVDLVCERVQRRVLAEAH
jgi:nucleoside-diphosphate-sugar epimerase